MAPHGTEMMPEAYGTTSFDGALPQTCKGRAFAQLRPCTAHPELVVARTLADSGVPCKGVGSMLDIGLFVCHARRRCGHERRTN